jgi:hypothetical protein
MVGYDDIAKSLHGSPSAAQSMLTRAASSDSESAVHCASKFWDLSWVTYAIAGAVVSKPNLCLTFNPWIPS